MALFARREFDHAICVDGINADFMGFRVDRDIVDACAATLDQPPRLAVRGCQTRARHECKQSDARFEFAAWQIGRWKAFGRHARLECLFGRFGCAIRRVRAVQHPRGGVGENFLRVVDLRALKRLQPGDLIEVEISGIGKLSNPIAAA